MDKKEKRAERMKAITDYVTGKGFYKVIGACLAVVVLAAWFVSAGISKKPNTDLTQNSSPVSIPRIVSDPNPTGQTGLSDQLLEGANSTAPVAASGTQTPVSEPDDDTEETAAPAKLLFVMPVSGELVTQYSDTQPIYSPTFRDWRVHAAVDLAGEVGTPVRAAAEGTVTSIKNDLMWGTTVTITHPGGYETKYCNLGAKPTVSENAKVEVGQVIGSIGQTAQAEVGQEPHLHFVLYKDGLPVDPATEIASLGE